jgi:hypothetical protein
MRALILLGSLTAAVGAAACGAQAASPFTTTDATGQTLVRCEPGQHAVVNTSAAVGGAVTAIDCVTDVAAPARRRPAPAYYAAQPVARPAVVRRVAAPVNVSDDDVVEQRPTRSWQKRALVIGGSSGAGAGIGALIGGKKGALIGAAIGGGGGTVYEMTRK